MRSLAAHRAWSPLSSDRASAVGRNAPRNVARHACATRRHHVTRRNATNRRDRTERVVFTRCAGDSEPRVMDGHFDVKPPVRPVMVEEVSTGGAQTRRWTRSSSGGFESFPPVRENDGNPLGTSSWDERLERDSDWTPFGGSRRWDVKSWDPRTSPRLRRIFLPAGYPNSVSEDYAPFIRWHLGSLVFRNVLEVLSAQSLLVSLGLGNAPGALPLTAATKWVLKDGVGSFATLAAGSLGGQKYDEDPKRYWAVSNSLEDVARAVELLTPAAPGLFLPLAATATFVRAAALTGRGSLMNGTFMQHLGRNENLGDVRAKLEVQGRWLALVALPAGVFLFRWVSSGFDAADVGDAASGALESPYHARAAALAAYSGVIGGHVFCCWKAAHALRFDTLNRARLCTAARAFVEGREIHSVDVAGRLEGVYKPRFDSRAPTVGASLPETARDWNALELYVRGRAASEAGQGGDARDSLARRRYALGWNATRKVPSAMLDADAQPRDVLEAALAATKAESLGSATPPGERTGLPGAIAEASYAYADAQYVKFEEAMLEAGWRVDFVQMGTAPKYKLDAI